MQNALKYYQSKQIIISMREIATLTTEMAPGVAILTKNMMKVPDV